MLNNVTIQGRITHDLEVRYTQSQKPVLSFSIACERDIKSQDGTRPTDFYDLVAWDHTADFISSYFAKGDMIIVSGRLQTRDWTDKNGTKRRSVEIIVGNAYFASSKKDRTEANVTPPAEPQFEELDEDDGEELPF